MAESDASSPGLTNTRNTLAVVVLVGLACYLIYALVYFVAQRDIMYRGTAWDAPAPPAAGSWFGLQPQRLALRDGEVDAFYLPALNRDPAEPGPAILFFHGNAELIDDWPERMEGIRAFGVAVLLVEYPGYGRSEGTPSQPAINELARAGFDWLRRRREVDGDRIVAMGRSLGSGPAAELALSRPVAGLVLQSGFDSVASVAWETMFLPPFLVRDNFDNSAALARYTGPVMILHGNRDPIVPWEHARRLYDAAPNAILITQRCQHNDCPPDWDIYWQAIAGFMIDNQLLTLRAG